MIGVREPLRTCRVCGSDDLHVRPVFWDRLVTEWQLAPAEAAYLDRQQGLHCPRCGAVLRTMALADAIGRCIGYEGPFDRFAENARARDLRVLEINSAPGLSAILSALPRHRQLAHPAIDMMAIAFPEATFDLVVHSDTLEHIPEPRRALAECRRVLAPGGFCCFSVPVVIGRLSRSRAGLPHSYHGAPGIELEDFIVHTEFGADIWSYVLEAGFRSCEIVCLEYPSGTAFKAAR
jgi:SAM-dependent methyltransferase